MNYKEYKDRLLQTLIDLIENKDVTQFYSGVRGSFDCFCCHAVHELKLRYPHIKSTMVLSYIPTKKYDLPKFIDDSIYLLERNIPKPFAIIETNKCLVNKVDYIVAGIIWHQGGASMAVEYANKRKKPIINLIEGFGG